MADSLRSLLTRREALRLAAMAGAGIAVGGRALAEPAEKAAPRGAAPLTRAIPSSGEKLPVVGLGTNQFGAKGAEEIAARKAVLERMQALGGTVIDTAPAYGDSEVVVGDLLAELGRRDRFFLATKVTARDGDLAAANAMLDASFKRLRTERIDLMQVHNLQGVDELMPVLAERKKAGRIRYVGITTSNNDAHGRMAELMGRHPLDFIQVDYSIANRAAADKVLPLAQEKKIGVLVNMPLGGRRSENLFAKVAGRELPPWAAEFDARSWAQFFLKYCLSHPAVTCVIPGTTKVKHLEDNQEAARGNLPDAEMRKRMEAYWDAGA